MQTQNQPSSIKITQFTNLGFDFYSELMGERKDPSSFIDRIIERQEMIQFIINGPMSESILSCSLIQ